MTFSLLSLYFAVSKCGQTARCDQIRLKHRRAHGEGPGQLERGEWVHLSCQTTSLGLEWKKRSQPLDSLKAPASSPKQFPQHKIHLCVPETGTVGRTVVIRRLDFPAGLDPLFFFSFSLSHSVHPPPPPFTALLPLHCTIIPMKSRVEQWEKTVHCSQFLLAIITAAKLIRAEQCKDL